MPRHDPTNIDKQSAPEIGRVIENAAFEYLCGRGLLPVERNYRCRLGEIDLIMLDGRQIVFFEVRYRRGSRFGHAAESIVTSKQRRVIMTAQHYLLTHAQVRELSARFDVLAVEPGTAGLHFDWIRDAFQA